MLPLPPRSGVPPPSRTRARLVDYRAAGEVDFGCGHCVSRVGGEEDCDVCYFRVGGLVSGEESFGAWSRLGLGLVNGFGNCAALGSEAG